MGFCASLMGRIMRLVLSTWQQASAIDNLCLAIRQFDKLVTSTEMYVKKDIKPR